MPPIRRNVRLSGAGRMIVSPRVAVFLPVETVAWPAWLVTFASHRPHPPRTPTIGGGEEILPSGSRVRRHGRRAPPTGTFRSPQRRQGCHVDVLRLFGWYSGAAACSGQRGSGQVAAGGVVPRAMSGERSDVSCLDRPRGAGVTGLAWRRRRSSEPTLWDAGLTALSQRGFAVSDQETSGSPLTVARDRGSHEDPRRLAEDRLTHDETAAPPRTCPRSAAEPWIATEPGPSCPGRRPRPHYLPLMWELRTWS